MASLARRHPDNVPGDFYVDSTCIDCDACRRIAPSTFGEAADHAYVRAQPEDEAARRRALMALVSCPTGSIGTASRQNVRPGLDAFPEPIADGVSFCGFTSAKSFGAWCYFVERAEGNVLVDSPKALPPLLERLAARGGVGTMFLTHRDDVADHEAFRRRFDCARVLHEADVTDATRGVEIRLSRNRARPARARSARHPDARPHARPLRAPLPGEVPLHRRSPRLVAPAPGARRVPGRLLVFVARADPVDGTSAGRPLRVGSAGARRMEEVRDAGTRRGDALAECVAWMRSV